MKKTIDSYEVTGSDIRLSMREAANYLGHSYSWLHTNHMLLGIPSYRIGGRRFFDLIDLIAWVENEKRNQTGKKLRRYINQHLNEKVKF